MSKTNRSSVKKPAESKADPLETMRHSTAHVLAMAILQMFPDAKLGIGPTIEHGFYYDFDLPRSLVPEDLVELEELMRKIIKKNFGFERKELSIAEALELVEKSGQVYKQELIKELAREGEKKVSFYETGDPSAGSEQGFIDLCRGPHVKSTKEIGAFKLTKIAGAYWRGNEKNKMLQRIYGLAFNTEEELDRYLIVLAEAEKRDHRKLGKELDLFIFSDLVGSGLPIYTPKGALVRKKIVDYSNELQKAIGYEEVYTPNINKAELFKISGHYEKYRGDMFRVASNYAEEEYFLKPMNCPQHTQVYASKIRSYKDLPIRLADFANLYRDEKPGELSGLARLRSFSQDDGHCFCREDQIREEFLVVLGLIEKAMKTYDMEYSIRLSLWDPSHPEKYLGEAKVWAKSQKLLEEILVDNKIDYERAEGEAAIYGPKMDLMSRDSLGRQWQISTIQLDFIMPQRFGLKYIDAQGKERTPVMIHRAIVGSPERFIGILLEHYAGAFPVWLAPVQVIILPVGSRHIEPSQKLTEEFKKNGLGVEVDDLNETVGNKIRKAEKQKIPYMIVIGDQEVQSQELAIRVRGEKEIKKLPVDQFISRIKKEIQERK